MIKLNKISTKAPDHLDKEETKEKTRALCEELAELQHSMYAQKKYSLLVILQGMDASGKDGTTRRVFGACSPQGINVVAFKKPTEEEMSHDFLWRIHKHAPAKGMVQIFNRSHYEDVLIQRVHRWIDDERAQKRITSINAFEELLTYDNDTIVLKFYMHLSKDEQKKELMERIEEPKKHWKHNPNDWKERDYWDQYIQYYEECFEKAAIPWHIIPVDQRWYGDYCIAKIVVETLKKLEMELPTLGDVID